MLQRTVPRRVAISPDVIVVSEVENIIPVDIVTIYENDLFGTYIPPVPVIKRREDTVASIPSPPSLIVSDAPVEKSPTFFTPLEVILKGVIFVKDDPANSLAIIQFKKTKEEQNYQVGDLIEDAQVLKILPNRIIVIRSNGQQETLYLREEDAAHDFDMEINPISKKIVQVISENKYQINVHEFVQKVHNLGEFVNLLDLTTVYKQGVSFGCRIGKIGEDSLGSMLGFMVDDVVIQIDNHNVDDLSNRIQLYDHIMHKKPGDIIEVVIYRDKDTATLLYGLISDDIVDIPFKSEEIHNKLVDHLKKQTEISEKDSGILDVKIQNFDSSNDSALEGPLDGVNSDIIDYNELESNDRIIEKMIDQEHVQYGNHAQENLNLSSIEPIITPQTLNESEYYKKRLIKEHDTLRPTLKDMKLQDRKKMLKQSNRNVILSGAK